MDITTTNELYRSSDAVFKKTDCSSITESDREIKVLLSENKINIEDPISLIHIERDIVDPIKYIDDNKWITLAVRIEVTTYFDTIDEDDEDMYIYSAKTYRLKINAEYFKQYWTSESIMMSDFTKNRSAYLSDEILDKCKVLGIFRDLTVLNKYYYWMYPGKRLGINFMGDLCLIDLSK